MDAVITWVDGNDPAHKAKRLAAMTPKNSRQNPSNATRETRFADKGEIYFCIASILQYAPFINRIFIVTADQTPRFIKDFEISGICAPGKIQIISHSDIFRGYEHCLPTFNSLSIETMLWRIPGLDDDFIYLNDDVFFNGPVRESDFFTRDGKLKVCGKDRSTVIPRLKLAMRRLRGFVVGKKMPANFKIAQAISAALAGRRKYVQLAHHPHALKKSLFADFFKANDALLQHQISHQFRTGTQFLPVGLCNHLALETGQGMMCDPRDVLYIKPSDYHKGHLADLAATKEKYTCIQSLDEFAPIDMADIRTVLSKKYAQYLPDSVVQKYTQNPRPTGP